MIHSKSVLYFVVRSGEVPYVLREALRRASLNQRVFVYFDLDGARALDSTYMHHLSQVKQVDTLNLLTQCMASSLIHMYVCQMNVMQACELHSLEGLESAGVVTFLEHAYMCDAVFSF